MERPHAIRGEVVGPDRDERGGGPLLARRLVGAALIAVALLSSSLAAGGLERAQALFSSVAAGGVQPAQAQEIAGEPGSAGLPTEAAAVLLELEAARARWFELVYIGRNFDVSAVPARHPEP